MVGFNNWRWETQTKVRFETFFFVHGDAEAFIMKGSSRDAQHRHHSIAAKVKLNPIGEITHVYVFLSSSFLSKHHRACQSTGPCRFKHRWFICGSWPFTTLSCLKPRDTVRSPQQRGVCKSVCSGLGKKEAAEGCAHPVGLHEILKTYWVSQLSKRKEKKFLSMFVRKMSLT